MQKSLGLIAAPTKVYSVDIMPKGDSEDHVLKPLQDKLEKVGAADLVQLSEQAEHMEALHLITTPQKRTFAEDECVIKSRTR